MGGRERERVRAGEREGPESQRAGTAGKQGGGQGQRRGE